MAFHTNIYIQKNNRLKPQNSQLPQDPMRCLEGTSSPSRCRSVWCWRTRRSGVDIRLHWASRPHPLPFPVSEWERERERKGLFFYCNEITSKNNWNCIGNNFRMDEASNTSRIAAIQVFQKKRRETNGWKLELSTVDSVLVRCKNTIISSSAPSKARAIVRHL